MKTDVNITIDLDELFDDLRIKEQATLVSEHLDACDISDIIDFLEERGYRVEKED